MAEKTPKELFAKVREEMRLSSQEHAMAWHRERSWDADFTPEYWKAVAKNEKAK
jgi:hypothetical protein